MGSVRNDTREPFTREKLQAVVYGLTRKLPAVDSVLRRLLTKAEGEIIDGQAMRFIVNLLGSSVDEIIAISKLPDAPLGEITSADRKEYNSASLLQFLTDDPEPAPESHLGRLSRREREVVKYLAEGKSNKEIAVALGLSVTTVQTYRARIMMKLNAHSLSDLVRFAVRHRLIEISLF